VVYGIGLYTTPEFQRVRSMLVCVVAQQLLHWPVTDTLRVSSMSGMSQFGK